MGMIKIVSAQSKQLEAIPPDDYKSNGNLRIGSWIDDRKSRTEVLKLIKKINKAEKQLEKVKRFQNSRFYKWLECKSQIDK
jgi:hypothetical protein